MSKSVFGLPLVIFLVLLIPGTHSLEAQDLTTGPHASEFVFARLQYRGNGYNDWPRWSADYPEAEIHFTAGLDRLTVVDVSDRSTLIRLDDNQIFDYPWLYVVEVGFMRLANEEAALLREYLLRGGFLMVDDFHGNWEWQNFEEEMVKIFPDRPIVDLANTNETFHVLYDLSSRSQIPGIRALRQNRTWEKGGRFPRWRGVLDDSNRLMIAINFNQDIGDAWEHSDESEYPQPLAAEAYRLGVNYVIYAMTH
ncbi:MAG: DUF4159 domain-containing protein [Granulosicoccus sp.]|nr:DUF4159 domain-containing protein [Granulosicoccus sp.]